MTLSPLPAAPPRPSSTADDEEIAARVAAGNRELFEILMRRHNQRIFRVARAILRDDQEAEDVMQEAWVRAYAGLDRFEGRARFSTWVTKIAVYESLRRKRRHGRFVDFDEHRFDRTPPVRRPAAVRDPERWAGGRELQRLLIEALDELAEEHRIVFVLRQVEGLSTAETAEALGISRSNVKVRLHRARAGLKRRIAARLGSEVRNLYAFYFPRCDRVVRAVFDRLDRS